jgi:hypothetical protein
MPDRYADAVRARRAELRSQRGGLAGTHRAELRSCLALSRIAATADIERVLAQVRREAAEHCRGGRVARRRLPGLLAAAVPEVTAAVHAAWAGALGPALRRIATERGLVVPADFPRLPSSRSPELPEPSGPARRATLGAVLAGAPDGVAVWRLLLVPLVVLPAAGIPALGAPALVPLALGVGAASIVGAVLIRAAAAERARLGVVTDQVVAATATALRSDLDRRLVEVERAAGAVLDAAVLRRRAAVDAELALLAPDPAEEAVRG